MRPLIRTALAATALVLVSAGASAQGNFSYGAWKGRAFATDGAFTHCAMSAKYRSGVQMLFAITRDYNLNMGFAHQDWTLPVGRNFPVSYRIDRRAAKQAPGRVVNPKQFVIDLPDRNAIFREFRSGKTLRMVIPGRTFRMSLKGTSGALNKLLACTRRFAR